jgi:hypothetical protein
MSAMLYLYIINYTIESKMKISIQKIISDKLLL